MATTPKIIVALHREMEMPLGGIVGVMWIADCVTEMDSEWFHGPFGFVISHAIPLDLIPCKGALGFFSPAAEILATAHQQMQSLGEKLNARGTDR